jgi:hypothetical protein
MSRSLQSNPCKFFQCKRKEKCLNANQLIELWNILECECKNGSTNTLCPLNKIIYILRRQRSFKTFKRVVKSVGSIARSRPERQKRKNHLRYISKCLSGPFYRVMDPDEYKEIKETPSLYNDSDSIAVAACDITEDSATEEMNS